MADQPTVAADRMLPLAIAGALRDRECVDVLGVGVSNLPPGTVLSAGTDNGDGSWTLAASDLDGLTITPPADRSGDVTLTVSAVARDAAGADGALTTTAFGLKVVFGAAPTPPVPPTPAPAIADAVGAADAGVGGERTVALDIDVGLGEDDAPGPISVAIGGLPSGATLSAGAHDGTGTWVLDASALPGLTLALPAGTPDQIALGIAATAADGTSATGVLALTVSELPDAEPEPELADEPAREPELEPEPVIGLEFEPAIEPEPEPEPAFDADTTPQQMPPPMVTAAPPGAHVPVAYWKLDESRPGIVGDELASHHGRSHGVAADASGGAFDTVDSFDGIDDYIVVPHAADLAPRAGTLTVWFNAFAGQGTIAARGTPATGVYLALAVTGRRLRFVLGDGETIRVAQGGAFGSAEWTQATITWGAAGMALYLNGEPVAADDFAGGLAAAAAPWLFGAAGTDDGGIGEFFHGELDDIAVYADQLDAAAVRLLFQIGVIGLMSGEAAATAQHARDSALNLDAIPVETEGPASLATLDAGIDDDNEDAGDVVVLPEATTDGDSPLDLDAIPAESEGPESLAVLDTEDEETGIAADANDVADAIAADVTPAELGAGGPVFVFGAGGDYFTDGDGWSDNVRRPSAADAPAVSVAAGGEFELAGGDKIEW